MKKHEKTHLFQFLIFLDTNPIYAQKRKVKDPCKTLISGKISLFYCNYGLLWGGWRDQTPTSNAGTGYHYEVEGENKRILVGSEIDNLKYYLSQEPYANKLIRQSNMFETTTRITTYVFFGAITYFAATAALDAQAEVTYRHKSHTTGILVGLSSLFIISHISRGISNYKLKKSIQAYNKAASKKTSFLQPLKPDYLTLGNAQGTAGISIGWHLGR